MRALISALVLVLLIPAAADASGKRVHHPIAARRCMNHGKHRICRAPPVTHIVGRPRHQG